jgi:hypothetical protein
MVLSIAAGAHVTFRSRTAVTRRRLGSSFSGLALAGSHFGFGLVRLSFCAGSEIAASAPSRSNANSSSHLGAAR